MICYYTLISWFVTIITQLYKSRFFFNTTGRSLYIHIAIRRITAISPSSYANEKSMIKRTCNLNNVKSHGCFYSEGRSTACKWRQMIVEKLSLDTGAAILCRWHCLCPVLLVEYTNLKRRNKISFLTVLFFIFTVSKLNTSSVVLFRHRTQSGKCFSSFGFFFSLHLNSRSEPRINITLLIPPLPSPSVYCPDRYLPPPLTLFPSFHLPPSSVGFWFVLFWLLSYRICPMKQRGWSWMEVTLLPASVSLCNVMDAAHLRPSRP